MAERRHTEPIHFLLEAYPKEHDFSPQLVEEFLSFAQATLTKKAELRQGVTPDEILDIFPRKESLSEEMTIRFLSFLKPLLAAFPQENELALSTIKRALDTLRLETSYIPPRPSEEF